jgi:hypothetical protein
MQDFFWFPKEVHQIRYHNSPIQIKVIFYFYSGAG